jgi:hypothetical protein
MDEMLDRVPDGVSVTADTFLLPHLYDKDELYMLSNDMSDEDYTDYFVFRAGQGSDAYNAFISTYESRGYELAAKSNRIEIYKKVTAPGLE